MNYLLPVAIGFTVASASLFNCSIASVVAQTPAASPAAPQSPEAAPVPSGPVPSEPVPSEPIPSEPELNESEPSEPVVPEGYQVITGDEWSFAVPADWQNLISESVDLGEDTSLVAQITDGQTQMVVNLVIQDYKGDNNDYIDESIATLSGLGTLHTQESVTISGWQGIALDFSLTSNDPPTRLLQRVIAANGTGYALTCGGREDNFAATQPVCTTILNSFQITPP